MEVQVVAVHSDEFSDSHSGRGKQVYEVFILKPGEDVGQYPADIVNGDFTEIAFLLILCKISADVISCHFRYTFLYLAEHFYYCVLIVCECLCGTAFYLLCGDESGKKF